MDTKRIGFTAHAVGTIEHRKLFPLTSISKKYMPWVGFSKNVVPKEFLDIQGENFHEKPFWGVHSEIGGGGYEDTRNMDALYWMIEQGQKAGALFQSLNYKTYAEFEMLHDLKGKMDHDSRYWWWGDKLPFVDVGRYYRTVFPGNN